MYKGTDFQNLCLEGQAQARTQGDRVPAREVRDSRVGDGRKRRREQGGRAAGKFREWRARERGIVSEPGIV